MPLIPKKEPPYYTVDTNTQTNTLTDAQIKASPTTPIILIPSPGTGKTIIVTKWIIAASILTPYTNIDNTNNSYISLCYGSPEERAASDLYLNLTDALTTLASYPGLIMHGLPNANAIYPESINNNVSLSIFNDALGNLTGGNTLNTITISIQYYVQNI